MDISSKILSDVIIHMKYAKHLPDKQRRETWEEIVTRNMNMHIKKFPHLEQEIKENYSYVLDRKVLPSMRAFQFSGRPIELNNARLFNCSAMAMNSVEAFSEAMFLLLSGCGVGYSVQRHHIEKLPPVRGPIRLDEDNGHKRRYLVGDSLEGWSDAIKVLMESYFYGKKELDFDYRDIRAKGAMLVTSGGKAPGPQPLKDCIHNICKVLDNAIAERGRNCRLKSLEVHDILCFISDAVLAGGIRRAAMISFFNIDDDDMLTCKTGNWWETNPQRARANNTVYMLRARATRKDFDRIWSIVKENNTGEPGIFFSNDLTYFGNPCLEASLKEFQFCNLTTMNVSTIESQEDFNNRCRVSAFLGTLQATYTDFHYLRDEWRVNTEKDALLGISMTGIASKWFLDSVSTEEGALCVLKENERLAKMLKINKASRTCLVKPDGTSSLVLGSSSGIHPWYAPYYIRRVRVSKDESIYTYFKINNPDMLEDDIMLKNTAIIKFPIKAPEGAITRNESPMNLLERIKHINDTWIVPGHRKGSNTHNTSVTISIKPDEWGIVGDWMWENKDHYNGISVLPYDNGSYIQPPFEEITKEQYEALIPLVHDIDLGAIYETQDNTTHQGEIACGGGGSCELR